MKNVLVIVYYFPPMGGSGVQRPLKFVKYLREFGWNPIILCPEPGAYPFFDYSLEKELEGFDVEVHRVKASTPFHLFNANKGAKTVTVSNKKAQFLRKISKLIYYPDNKKAWIKPALLKGKELIKSNNIDLIFSTAPPFSNHLAATELKKQTGIPLVLDYRDSWLNNHFMTDLFEWQKMKMKKLEKSCLSESDMVIGLDDFMLNVISKNHPELSLTTKTISHGFDPEDFEKSIVTDFNYQNGKLNFLYSGLFYEANQPDIFLNALKIIFNGNSKLKDQIHLHFQGGIDNRISKIIQELGFVDIVSDYGYVNHSEAVYNLGKADVLWMISNFSKDLKQIKSGKLFEYVGAQKAILGFVHKGEASKLLEEYKAGFSVAPDNLQNAVEKISTIIQLWQKDKLPKPSKEFIDNFNRRLLTKKLAESFNVITDSKIYL